jgi:hypothetical protein
MTKHAVGLNVMLNYALTLFFFSWIYTSKVVLQSQFVNMWQTQSNETRVTGVISSPQELHMVQILSISH